MRPGKEWLDLVLEAISKRFGGGSRKRRCVVLIDGDAVQPGLTHAVVRYASTLGRLVVLEVFANFSSGTNSGWAEEIRKYGLVAFQHYRTSVGKNSADTALIVRGMDLFHTTKIDDVVLATSDSDFAAFAHRLRRGGVTVHGIGSAQASAVLRRSCSAFSTFAELEAWAATTTGKLPSRAWFGSLNDAEDQLLRALVRLGGARGWVSLDALGPELRATHAWFDARAYSRRTVHELCTSLSSIELEASTSGPRARIALSNRNGSSEE